MQCSVVDVKPSFAFRTTARDANGVPKQCRRLLRRRFRFVGDALPIFRDRFPIDVAFGAGPNGSIIRVVRLRTLVCGEIVHSHERRRLRGPAEKNRVLRR